MVVRELLTRLGFQIDNRNINIYNTTINNIRNNADRAAASLNGLFGALLGFGTLTTLKNVAEEAQGLEARMAQMVQTTGAVGDTFEAVAQHASNARQSLKAYGTLYIRIGNASQDLIKDQNELLGIVDTVSQALIVGGVASTEQASAMLQLSQAFNKGKLDGDEFKSVMEAMPPVFTRGLAEAMGYKNGLAEFYKASSSGKLTIESLIAALKKIGPEISRQFVSMPLNISQAFVIIGNRFQVFIARLNRDSNAVTGIANFFIATFNKIEDSLDNMIDFFGSATNTLKFFGIALAAVLAPMAFRAAAGAVAFLVSPMGLLLASLILVGLALEDLYQWLNFGDSIIGQFLGGLTGIGIAVKFVDDLKKSFVDFVRSDSIQFLIKRVIDFKNALSASFNGGAISKFLSALSRLSAYLAEVIPFDKIMANLAVIFQGAIKLFFGILDVVTGVLKAALGFLTGDFDLWYEGVKQIFGGLGEAASGLWNILRGAAAQYLTWMGTTFKIAFDAIGSIIGDSIFGGIKWAAQKGWNFLKSLFGFGVNANVGMSTAGIGSMTPAVPSVSPSTVAGAAAAPNGVAGGNGDGSVVIKIDQTLPPGTPAETAAAARDAVNQAFNALPIDRLARQMGQVGG